MIHSGSQWLLVVWQYYLSWLIIHSFFPLMFTENVNQSDIVRNIGDLVENKTVVTGEVS